MLVCGWHFAKGVVSKEMIGSVTGIAPIFSWPTNPLRISARFCRRPS
jgi:hypothetical protein